MALKRPFRRDFGAEFFTLAFSQILSLAAYGAFLHGWWIPLVRGDGLASSAALITAYMLTGEKRSGATRRSLDHEFLRGKMKT